MVAMQKQSQNLYLVPGPWHTADAENVTFSCPFPCLWLWEVDEAAIDVQMVVQN